MTGQRLNVLSWDEYFMSIALISAQRSKDPSTQVGACIVDENNHIIGIGYNGFPNGCKDDDFPWEKQSDDVLNTKYPYVCHAEMNAILNATQRRLEGCRMFVTLHPCNECAKMIIQCGIQTVYFLQNKYPNATATRATQRMFRAAKIQCAHWGDDRHSLVVVKRSKMQPRTFRKRVRLRAPRRARTSYAMPLCFILLCIFFVYFRQHVMTFARYNALTPHTSAQ